jgi:hypothetical protein
MSQVQTPSFTPEQIAAAVKRLTTAGKTMARSVETLLVMAVYDSIVNESATTANALIGALRKSTRRAGVIAFLEHHGKLYMAKGSSEFAFFNLGAVAKLEWTPEYVDTVQEAAMDWESFKPPVAAKDALDVLKALEALVERVGKEQKASRPVVNADLAPQITALIARYAGAQAVATIRETSKEAVAA